MILTGPEILARMDSGQIKIDPFDRKRLNPNSYNLRLGEDMLVYDQDHWQMRDEREDRFLLDMKSKMETSRLFIPKDGLVLEPGILYLASTMEYTESHGLVPMLEGRSSVGRLGLFVHVTAGFGDSGFCGRWTLELTCVQPIRIYAGVEICQIFYHEMAGEDMPYKSGKYQGATGPQPSGLWKDFLK